MLVVNGSEATLAEFETGRSSFKYLNKFAGIRSLAGLAAADLRQLS